MDFNGFKMDVTLVHFFHLIFTVGLRILVDRTEPNFLGIKMDHIKLICEILEEFCGVTAPRKIIEILK